MMDMSPAGELASDLADLALSENRRGAIWIVSRIREPDLSMVTLVLGGNGSLIGSVC